MAKSKPKYDEVRTTFDRKWVLRDLKWEESNGTINLGHTILDRHAQSHRVALYWKPFEKLARMHVAA